MLDALHYVSKRSKYDNALLRYFLSKTLDSFRTMLNTIALETIVRLQTSVIAHVKLLL